MLLKRQDEVISDPVSNPNHDDVQRTRDSLRAWTEEQIDDFLANPWVSAWQKHEARMEMRRRREAMGVEK